ncbi:FAD:protein FMN transferase [Kaarinaea lacus]
MSELSITEQKDYIVGHFKAMASPCEVLVDTSDRNLARMLVETAMNEARRIEQKFSRYRSDNIIYKINHSNGQTITVDEETANLLDYAEQCYRISEGLFDITSGVLRKIWTFDGSDNIPQQSQIDQQLQHIGWDKLNWNRPDISLPEEMEIDFGGIGKEYAVDQASVLILNKSRTSCLINFGGDICATGARRNGQPWIIGIEDPDNLDAAQSAGPSIQLTKGAIATSGDTRKFLLKDGVRYGHVLNPKTGWPTKNGPRSITVAASSCTEAGILATLALLQNEEAEAFLKKEKVDYWCEW